MSLKVFHLVFIALSVLMAAVVGGWGVSRHLSGANGNGLVLGIGFFLLGAAMLVYGVKVLRKFREIGR